MVETGCRRAAGLGLRFAGNFRQGGRRHGKALADKPAKQAASERGQKHPGALDWSSRKAERFVAKDSPVKGTSAPVFRLMSDS